jgi:hypothetical protein
MQTNANYRQQTQTRCDDNNNKKVFFFWVEMGK